MLQKYFLAFVIVCEKNLPYSGLRVRIILSSASELIIRKIVNSTVQSMKAVLGCSGILAFPYALFLLTINSNSCVLGDLINQHG